jgi:nicotinamidase-related amidase
MKTALLVIDVQRDLFDPEPRPGEADAVLARINGLSAKARAAGVPVIFVQHEYASDELVYGTPGWELATQLDVQAGDLRSRKTTADSFHRTDLGEILLARDIETLVVCGYATQFCVDTTARRAVALGYDVVLAADAHTTHDQPYASAELIRRHHNATLPNLDGFGATIKAINASDIVFG